MASTLPPVKGVAFSFEMSLVSQADTDTFQANPTLAAGDVKIIKDGVYDDNIDTLPTAVTSCTHVITVALSATEMNADRVAVVFRDVSGSEWQDALVTIYTTEATFDTVFPAAAAGAIGGLPVLDANLAASANVTLWNGAAVGAAPATVADLPSEPPSASDNATAAAAAILVTPANKLATLAAGEIVISPETVVLAYVSQIGPVAQQDIRDSAKLAPSAGDPAAGSVDAKLDDIVEDTGTTLPGLIVGSGTYSYSNTVDDGSGNLLDGVRVELATDIGFTNIVSATHTDSEGAFTVYSDLAGTHYLRLQLAGYAFTIQTVVLA